MESESNNGTRILSEKTAMELLFKSNNEIVKFYRNPNKRNSEADITELEKWVETYFQASIMIFPIHKVFNPYKVKLGILPRLLRKGNIFRLFDHLTEATENSNHGLNNLYHNHTMRDGGYATRNTTSEHDDLFNSFVQAFRLATERKLKANPSADLGFTDLLTSSDHDEAKRVYSTICRTPLPTLQLKLGKKENIFKYMKFYFILPGGVGDDGKHRTKSFSVGRSFIDPITNNRLPPAAVTKISLHHVVEHLQGEAIADNKFDTYSQHRDLQYCYVVLNDDEYFRQYENRAQTSKTVNKRFLQATRSSFKFVKANYIVDCFLGEELLDPTLPAYSIKYDATHFVKGKRKTHVTSHMARQRSENQNVVMPKTALKRFRSALKRNSDLNSRTARVAPKKKTQIKYNPRYQRRLADILFLRYYSKKTKSIAHRFKHRPGICCRHECKCKCILENTSYRTK